MYITTSGVQELKNNWKPILLKMANLLIDFRDLKRDVAKKLEKLEKRTQRAIVELISKSYMCLWGIKHKWIQF